MTIVIGDTETYPANVMRFYVRALRCQSKFKQLLASAWELGTKHGHYSPEVEHIRYLYKRMDMWRWALTYTATLAIANAVADENPDHYLRLMQEATIYYNRWLRDSGINGDISLNYPHKYEYLGGKLNERTAKTRATKRAKKTS